MSSSPAAMLGITDSKGSVKIGADADLVILDTIEDGNTTCLQIAQVWKFGVKVFDAQEENPLHSDGESWN